MMKIQQVASSQMRVDKIIECRTQNFIQILYKRMESSKFAEQVKNLFKGNSINTDLFWRTIDEPDSQQNVAYYCYRIFHYIVDSDKKQTAKLNNEKLLSTLLVLEFYKNKKMKKKQIIDEIKNLVEKPEIRGHSKWILQFFTNQFKEEQVIQSLICQWTLYPFQKSNQSDPGQIIIDEIDLMPISNPNIQKEMKYFQVLKRISEPSHVTYESSVLSFSYVCFLDYVRGQGNYLDIKIYRHLSEIFIAHIHALRQYQKTEQYLLSTIHVIETIITFYSCPYNEILSDLIFWANQLRNCPQFYGQIGQQLFTLLHNEMKNKGYNFRKKLRRDFPSLDIKNANRINKEFYLVSEMKEDYFSRPQHCAISTLRKLIIINILKVSGVHHNQMVEYVQLIESLDLSMTFELYYKLMKLTDITSGLEVHQKAKSIIKDSVQKIMNQTLTGFKKQDQEASKLEIQDFSQMYHDSNPLGIFEYPFYEIINVNINAFINSKSEYFFPNIAKKNKNQYPKLEFYQNKISIVFFGNANTFSKILPIFVEYYSNKGIQDIKHFQLYYIPSQSIENRCGIATYLASRDIWYKRFIFSTFRDCALLPEIQMNSKSKDLFLSYLLNKSLHMYLRQANRKFFLKFFKCHIIYAPTEKEKTKKQEIIYFSSYILIGTSAEAEALKKRKEKQKDKEEKYSKMDYIEILTQKIKKPEILLLNMKAECYNHITKTTERKLQKDLKVQDIQILNLPKDYFMGRNPNPATPDLQMTLLLDLYGKKFRKQVSDKNNFKKIPQAQIIQAFKELFICLTIKNIELSTCHTQFPFSLLIDGQQYKGVESIAIQPVLSMNEMPISIPIMTFLPFQS